MKYDLIYTDPAWSYKKDTGRGVAKNHYDTMPLEDIKNLPVNQLLKKNAIVYMWATFPLLREAFQVGEAWGLEYIGVGLNWIKLNDDGTPFIGLGHHTRANGEIALIFKKGKGLPRSGKCFSQVILSKIERHSQKPKKAYKILEELYGDVKRLEMFARHKREGWEVWGNQAPKYTQKVLRY